MAYAAFAVRMPFNVAIAGMCCDSKIAICHKRLASLEVLPRNIIALARSFLHLHLVWSLRVDRAGPDLVYSLRHLFQIPLSTTNAVGALFPAAKCSCGPVACFLALITELFPKLYLV